MRAIEARLRRLEQAALVVDPLTVVLLSFVSAIHGKPEELGYLSGYEIDGQFVSRRKNESEVDCIERIKAAHTSTARPAQWGLVLHEVRQEHLSQGAG